MIAHHKAHYRNGIITLSIVSASIRDDAACVKQVVAAAPRDLPHSARQRKLRLL